MSLITKLRGNASARDGTSNPPPPKTEEQPPAAQKSGAGLIGKLQPIRAIDTGEDLAPTPAQKAFSEKNAKLESALYAAKKSRDLRQVDVQAREHESARRIAFVEETTPYPAKSAICTESWESADDGDHLVFEIWNAKDDSHALMRISKSKFSADLSNDYIAAIFDRTILVVGAKAPPPIPDGYRCVPVRSERSNSDAYALFPEGRDTLLSLISSDPATPVLLKMKRPQRSEQGPSL
jgi:hypothetical protein